jgi:diguanylate cyclase (GGDEF)-like protein
VNEPPKILVVDDESDIQRYIQINLRQQGYNVILGNDGEEAVSMALKEKPDLILLDVRLPGIDGMEACKRIKAQSPSFIPVILVTVQSQLKDKIAGMDHGADDYLSKPFVIDELFTRVASMLRIKKLYDDQEQASVTDTLTGIHNRRYFQTRLKEECERVSRYGGGFSCLMLDLDHFKKINDEKGHLFGDEVLRQFAMHVKGLIRRTDVFVRYGGEEFVLILPETGLEKARQMAEILRSSVEKKPFTHGGLSAQVTCSIGVCPFPGPTVKTFEGLMNYLDHALYAAKDAGRNVVRVHFSEPGQNVSNL